MEQGVIERVDGGGAMVAVNDSTRTLRRARSVQFDDVWRALETGAWVTAGFRSATPWLSSITAESPSASSVTLRLAERIQQMPQVKATFADGVLAESALRQLTDLWSFDIAGEFARDERMLLGWALQFASADLKMLLATWLLHNDPDAAEKTAQEQFESRELHLSSMLDSMGRLDGLLDPEGFNLVREAVRHLSGRAADDERPRAQRQADALVTLAKNYLATDSHVTGKRRNRPRFVATSDYDNLIAEATGGTLDTNGGHITITPEAVRRIACDASVHRLITNGQSTVLDFGRRTQSVSDPLFDVLALRDHGCRWNGCNVAAAACDAHHAKHWADGGTTDQSNLVLLCWFHHHLLHEQHWSIKPLGGGHFTLQDPHGQTHPTRPPQIGLTLPLAQPVDEHSVAPLFNPPV
jgi:hypothetical protein